VPRVFLGVGSNVNAEENLRLGIRELRARYGELTISPVYRNKPVGFEGEDFLNLVLAFETTDPVEQIADHIEAIHRQAGRVRGEAKFASRSLDIDILLYGQTVSQGPPAVLPRPDVLQYSFVLKPLADIAPEAVHPETGASFVRHWQLMERQGSHALQRVWLDLA